MNLTTAHYFLFIPSVLAIIMVSRVHPFPYTETKSWIHYREDESLAEEHNQLSSSPHNKASRRSSFGGECPDCLSQEEASLRLLLHPTYKTRKTKMVMPLLLPSTPALEEELDYDFNEKDEAVFTGASDDDDADASDSSLLFQNLNRSSSISKSSGKGNSNLSSYYKDISRRRRIKRRARSTVGYFSFQQDLNNQKHSTRKVRDTSSLTPCLAEREEKLTQAQSSRSSEYIPNCRKDGSYAHVQCHPSTKSCWCVTRNGRAIPGSSVFSAEPILARPNCAKYNRRSKSTTRRSSQFRKNRKSCNHADWTKFSIALLKTFRSEYNRYRAMTAATSGESPSDRIILSWKFDHVDRNKDRILQRNETNILKNLVKQQIQPRSCAKNFISLCSNGDSQITKNEWLDCFRVSSDYNLSSSSSSTSGSGSMEATLPFLTSVTVGETTEQSNCRNDRQSALASQKQNESIIIPECTPNGNYRKVQCAQVLLTGKEYCWCVEEETGIQIPNTIVFNTTVDCNNGYSKPMKGCSGAKKHKFLIDLFSTLKTRMAISARDGGTRRHGDGPRNTSLEEQASRWYFAELDVNKNGILDRNEWKQFRNETSLDKRLKKCGKKLPRHCDVNQDKKNHHDRMARLFGSKIFG